jgi:hypothetical protein
MKYLLESYLSYFVHPIQSSLAAAYPLDQSQVKLNLQDSILISWIFQILRGLFQVIFFYFIIETLKISTGDYIVDGLLSAFLASEKFTSAFLFIIPTVLELLFFPLVSYFYCEFWIYLLKHSFRLAALTERREELAEQIVVRANTSHVFSVVPIIGELFQKLAFIFYLYIGLRRSAYLSRFESIIIVLSPIFIVLFVIFLLLNLLMIFKW